VRLIRLIHNKIEKTYTPLSLLFIHISDSSLLYLIITLF
jgi:hypothetical protein